MRAPAYQFYGSDFEQDTAAMSNEEVGAYVRLLNFQWKKVAVPCDIERMAKICRTTPARMRRLWPALEEHFEPSPNGLQNPRMERIRSGQAEFRDHMKELSARGVETRTRNRAVNRAVDRPVNQDPGTPLLTPISDSVSGSGKKRPTDAPPVSPPAGKGLTERPAIPAELAARIPGFGAMWAERMKATGRNRRPTASAEAHQLEALVKALGEHGPECVIATVEAATRGGYQGLPLDRFTANGLRKGRDLMRGRGVEVDRQHDKWANDLDGKETR